MEQNWIQVISLFLANTGLIVWFRAESRSDWRHMDNKLEITVKTIQEDMRDFHGRLCEIEASKKK